MNTLIVVAHPDDETLGAGGTIARLTSQGDNVHIAVLGKSRAPRRDLINATLKLGTISVAQYDLPDQQFEIVPLTTIIGHIETLIDKNRARTIYTHHAGDLNQDHAITHRAVLTACRPTPTCPVRTIYAMEIPSSTDWSHSMAPPFQPNTYVDISATLERKVGAMQMYETERRQYPHPRSPQMLRALAQYRGAQAGLTAAEAFQLIRHTA